MVFCVCGASIFDHTEWNGAAAGCPATGCSYFEPYEDNEFVTHGFHGHPLNCICMRCQVSRSQ